MHIKAEWGHYVGRRRGPAMDDTGNTGRQQGGMSEKEVRKPVDEHAIMKPPTLYVN